MRLAVQFRERLVKLDGEPLAAEFSNITDVVSRSWAREHKDDDTHGAIHADSVTERERLTKGMRVAPMGEWINVIHNPNDYTASGTMAWTVGAADLITFRYMLIGNTLWVSGVWDTTSVTAPLSTTLRVKIPGGYVAAQKMAWANVAVDSGVAVATINRVLAGGTVLEILRFDAANWTAAVNATDVRFHGGFEIKLK